MLYVFVDLSCYLLFSPPLPESPTSGDFFRENFLTRSVRHVSFELSTTSPLGPWALTTDVPGLMKRQRYAD